MNPNYNEFRFPQIKSHPWSKVFDATVDTDAIDLVSCFLKYAPTERRTGLDALGHPFFSEILQPGCTLPDGVLNYTFTGFSVIRSQFITVQIIAGVTV